MINLEEIRSRKRNSLPKLMRPLYDYLCQKSFRHYNGWYWFTHPLKLISEPFNIVKQTIKHFWQRGRYGFTDADLWNMDNWIADTLSAAVTKFRGITHSHPSDITYDEWLDILTEISNGFEAFKQMARFEWNESKTKELTATFKKGMNLLTERFQDLWD